eukprot:3202403-Pyramimonas_sp.AAC.1
MSMFERLCHSHDIVVTQETHGHPGDIDHLSLQLPSHQFGYSFFPDSAGAGGVITAISKVFARNFSSIVHRSLIDGRVLLTEMRGPHGQCNIVNVHMPNTSD